MYAVAVVFTLILLQDIGSMLALLPPPDWPALGALAPLAWHLAYGFRRGHD